MPLWVRAIDVGGPDLARVVVVSRRAEPDAAWGEDDFRRAAGHEPRHLVLLATDDREDAGAAELAAIEAWDESLAMWLSLWVVPGRHGDAGALLWEAIRGHCAAHGLTGLRAAVSSDRVELLELLLAKGFREVERDQRVRLRLQGAPPPLDPPAGIALTTLAERPELLGQIHEIDAETIPDIPGEHGAQVKIPDGAWWRERLRDGTFRATTVVVAVDIATDRAAAYTVLRHYSGLPEVADHEYTATVRAWRGRGLAPLVKRAGIAAAWDAGVRELRAWNNLDNAPMRAVNARLGYERGSDVLQLRAEFTA